MLTVKHIRFDGAETIDHAERVIFYPHADEGNLGSIKGPMAPHRIGVVTAVGAISGGVDWHSGTVYVMNENGATVAKYDLGPGPKPGDTLGVAMAA